MTGTEHPVQGLHLDDFQRHWPTDGDHVYVDFVRDGGFGNGAARMGSGRWRRLTEQRARAAKSVFHFDVPGSVAKSTHAGLPWLRYIRHHAGEQVHFWPFDGWHIAAGKSVAAEVYPALWSRRIPREGRTPDQAIRWLDDRLPGLTQVHRLGLGYYFILLSAVWMHVQPPDRPRAFRKLATLLKPGAAMVITLRDGPPDTARPMWSTPVGEIEALARDHGLGIVHTTKSPDALGRRDVRWRAVVLRAPDDGTGALPLLRGIILNDDKSSTYKLGLLRAIARIADLTPGVAVMDDATDAVDVPLGLVALNWVRMYLPLVSRKLPQLPRNAGPDGLGFAKDGFRNLLAMNVRAQDLRVGAQFAPDRAAAVASALHEARNCKSRLKTAAVVGAV